MVKRERNQKGELNNNWKGGISKNNYRYKLIQIERYPEKYKARRIISALIRSGKVKRLPCEICKEVVTDAHHDDYTKPTEVRWLCEKHHRELHENLKKRKFD